MKYVTMTRESAFDNVGATMSHGWGASTIAATVENLVGLKSLAPAFKRFKVKPQLGDLGRVAVKIPTPHGFIEVNASNTSVEILVPCNTIASLCIVAAGDASIGLRLTLDGVAIATEDVLTEGNHACVHEVGCGVAGMARRLAWVNESEHIEVRMKGDDEQMLP
jgi:hypothetical protein